MCFPFPFAIFVQALVPPEVYLLAGLFTGCSACCLLRTLWFVQRISHRSQFLVAERSGAWPGPWGCRLRSSFEVVLGEHNLHGILAELRPVQCITKEKGGHMGLYSRYSDYS